MAELLRVEQASKHYDGIHALKDASFAVAPGEAHALMGENGAGKSTLAKIIAGSVKADSGRIFLDGQPVSIASPLDARRLGIGIIYQELDLFPRLTIAENIVIGFVNGTLGFVLKIITFPLSILTLGIFWLVINALMLKIAAALVPGFRIEGFLPAFFGAIVLSLVNMVLKAMLGA